MPHWKKARTVALRSADFPARRDWIWLVASFIVLVMMGAFVAWGMLRFLWADTASESPTHAETFETLRTEEFNSFIRTYDTKRQKLLGGE